MWKYYEQPANLRILPAYGLTADEEVALRTYGWHLLLCGEDDSVLLGSYARDDLGLGLDDAEIDEIFAWLLDARRSQQAEWGDEPVPTMLTQAFAALEQHNVLAREDFTCCVDCATRDIQTEFDDTRNWIGAVYYHQGDTADIVESGSGRIGFGVRIEAFLTAEQYQSMTPEQLAETYEELTMSMMKGIVIPILVEHGIDVNWSEDIADRLRIDNVTFYTRV